MQHSAQTVKRCKKLCDDRCNDRTRNAPVEHHNKQQIKPDIQNRCNDHGIQRRFAVAERTQDACKHVIRHDDGYTRKHDAQVCERAADDLLRRVHGAQHGCHGDLAQNDGQD